MNGIELSRRGFVAGMAAMAAGCTRMIGGKTDAGAAVSIKATAPYVPLVDHGVAPRNRRPYSGLDWAKCRQITTTSHGHCDDQPMLDQYVKHGFGLMTISNYYPSAPRYPGREITRLHYNVHTDYPVMVKGVRTDGPFDWNKIIAPWKDRIDPKFRGEYPFDSAKDGKLFPNWPEGMLEAPNAEHHAFLLDDGKPAKNLHINGLGSFFKSGTVDKWNKYLTVTEGGYCFGSGESWRTATDRMIKELMFADGGGVTINHPTWSNLDRELFLKMLDHDPRVLGCEALNSGINDEPFWDWALATGRQCFGFFVPDHPASNLAFSANILVVPEPTVHECLRAYRQGNFYGSLNAMGELRFTGVAFDGKVVAASTDKPAKMQVITAKGVVKETEGGSIAWEVPQGKWDMNGPGVHVFARIKAFARGASEEIIWSQAFMLQR